MISIKNKVLLTLTTVAIISVAFNIFQFKTNVSLVQEVASQKQNVSSLKQETNSFRTKSNLSAVQCKQLILTLSELKQDLSSSRDSVSTYQTQISSLRKALNELSIKPKYVESASVTESSQQVKVITKVEYRDSLYNFTWSDPWTVIEGSHNQDSIRINYCSTDTIIQVIERVPKKFLFFRWGCKEIRQVITTSNPHTNLIYTTSIKVK